MLQSVILVKSFKRHVLELLYTILLNVGFQFIEQIPQLLSIPPQQIRDAAIHHFFARRRRLPRNDEVYQSAP